MAWEQLVAAGIQAAGAIGATAASQGMTKAARRENYQYNELAAGHALERQKELQEYLLKMQERQYYDLESPKAVMQQLKNAGLSPSLYAQGATGGNVSGISTASAPQGAGTAGVGAPMAQNPLDVAGTYLAMAQARKANAEADEIYGDTERSQAEIAKLIEEKIGIQAKTTYLRLQADIAETQKYIASKTADFNIAEAQYKAEQAEHQAHYLLWHAKKEQALTEIEEGTIKAKIDSEYLKNANLLTHKQLLEAQIGLTDEQANKCISEVEKWREELIQQWWQLNINEQQVKSYSESVKIDKDFKEKSIQALNARIEADKEIAKNINETRLKELTETWVNDLLSNYVSIIVAAIKK